MKIQKISPEHISLIEKSIENRNLISISYVDRKNVPSVRTVEPYEVKPNGLFYGYCLTKNGIRAFNSSSIQSIEVLKEKYTPRY